jgi:hypothetical protein
VQSKGEDFKMGGGSSTGLTPQGIIAAGVAYNPKYGKMAADSIAKELEERKLIPPAATTEEIASDGVQAAPATPTDEITSSEHKGAGIRE